MIASLLLVALACSSPRTREPSSASGGEVPLARVEEVAITFADLDAALRLFVDTLGGAREDAPSIQGTPLVELFAVSAVQLDVTRVRFGDQRIALRRAPSGARGYRDAPVSNDLDFQHLALVTGDIDGAWARVLAAGVTPVSPDPQRIPDANPDAGGIRAAYFRDAEGHPLELIWYPEGRGDPRWQSLPATAAVGGIDHSAIASSDTEASVRFWVDVVGLEVAGEAHNAGIEQERLSGVQGARVHITGMRGSGGPPGVELLDYEAPGAGRPARGDASATDLTHYEVAVRVPDLEAAAERLREAGVPFTGPTACPGGCIGRALLTRDPDAHAVQIRGR